MSWFEDLESGDELIQMVQNARGEIGDIVIVERVLSDGYIAIERDGVGDKHCYQGYVTKHFLPLDKYIQRSEGDIQQGVNELEALGPDVLASVIYANGEESRSGVSKYSGWPLGSQGGWSVKQFKIDSKQFQKQEGRSEMSEISNQNFPVVEGNWYVNRENVEFFELTQLFEDTSMIMNNGAREVIINSKEDLIQDYLPVNTEIPWTDEDRQNYKNGKKPYQGRIFAKTARNPEGLTLDYPEFEALGNSIYSLSLIHISEPTRPY